jgi:hypothetical protein
MTSSTNDTLSNLRCHECGAELDIRLGGRPRREIAVRPLLDAFERLQNVRATARELGLPPGTVWHRLNDAGVLNRRPGSIGTPRVPSARRSGSVTEA